jgi:DGQHR domain-containing protein
MEKTETIEVPVLLFEQKGVRNYVGVMKAKDILDVWHVDRFIENQMIFRGYQRQEEENRMREVYEYVENCQIPIIPAILASVRRGSFKRTNHNTGILELPRVIGALEIVDGQHRIGGFWIIKRLIEGERIGRRKLAEEEISKLENLLNFEIPVHFIDAESAVKRMEELVTPELKENMLKELNKKSLGPEDVERVHFFVINKTQKAIRPSLKDTLVYLIYATGIRGIPVIEKEKWKAEIATPLTLDLHFAPDSPLR